MKMPRFPLIGATIELDQLLPERLPNKIGPLSPKRAGPDLTPRTAEFADRLEKAIARSGVRLLEG
jgi:hypothetical protein